jgi:plastocyanin
MSRPGRLLSRIVLTATVAVMTIPALASGASDSQRHEVVIRATALGPAVLHAFLHERVTFRNQSGRIVHVQFLGEGGQHHVVQVPGSIWAEFHQPGEHPYVVHFESGRPAELAGRVEVEVPLGGGDSHDCNGVTVNDACIPR